MKAYKRVEVQLHTFLTSVLDGVVGFRVWPIPIEQQTDCALESIWTIWKREKSLAAVDIRTPDCAVRSLVTIRTALIG